MEHQPLITKGWVRGSLYLVVLIFALFIFGTLGYIFISSILGGPPAEMQLEFKENIYFLVVYYLFIAAGVTLVTFLLRKHIDRKNLKSIGFQTTHLKKDIIIGAVTGLVPILTGFVILYISGLLSIEGIVPDLNYLTGSLFVFILVSWNEELAFRGYVLNNLMESMNPYLALIVSSFIFALFHTLNPGLSALSFFNLFLAGLLLGIVFIHTKTIWYALSLHLFWNFFLGPVLGFRVSGTEAEGLIKISTTGPDYLTGGAFGFEGSVISSVLIIICIIILNNYYNKSYNKALKKKQ